MSLIAEIEKLENNMFDSIYAAHMCIDKNDRENAEAYIATVEFLNQEYKEITKTDFVKSEVVLDLYERLWRKANA